MEDYNNLPSNSKSSKVVTNEEPQIGQVKAKVEKRNGLDKLADIFIRDDIESVGNRIVYELIVPNIMTGLRNVLVNSIDMIFKFKPAPSQSSNTNTGRVNVVNYNNVISGQNDAVVTQNNRSAVYDYAKVCFATLDDAKYVVNQMREIIKVNRFVTVGRYMELTKAGTMPTDYYWCWTNLDSVGVGYTNDPNFPYFLQLPNPVPVSAQQRISI